jgi:hypothetical protein
LECLTELSLTYGEKGASFMDVAKKMVNEKWKD